MSDPYPSQQYPSQQYPPQQYPPQQPGTAGQHYGAPPQGGPYGDPPQGGGGSGYPVPEQGKGRNGFAVASFLLGLFALFPFGIGFGIAGLVRARKVGRGTVLSVLGLLLSAVWLAGAIYLVPHLAKASDPGCVAAKDTLAVFDDAKMNADSNNEAAFKKDLETLVSQLNTAAGKSTNDSARTSIKKLANDFTEFLTDINKGRDPASDLQKRVTDDAGAVDTACGTLGS